MILDRWSAAFAVVAAAVLYRRLPARRRPGFLAAFSLGAYAWYDVRGLVIVLPLAAVTYALIGRVRASSRAAFVSSVTLAVALLAAYKFLERQGSVALPMGLSYLAFQSILTLLEARRQRSKGRRPANSFPTIFFFPRTLPGRSKVSRAS
ncbi:MAG: hypothetical protein M5R36_22755 [Deltaproteobacteria bacterium]|nr:hypothetical protein [Deltaproteobacteria bacterium]